MSYFKIFMKQIVAIIFIFWTVIVSSQDLARIDAMIQLYPTRCDTPEDLSKFISRDFNTDIEKVRAIYSWIINNISYEPREYKKFDYSFKNYRERNLKEEETRKKIIQRTINKGLAVCEGYAMLFERLCELQGIDSYLVRGDTKSKFDDIGRPFQTNHMWNVAYIDGKPYLFDVTWGAGRYQQEFVRDTSYHYFMIDPEKFMNTHYPDMYEDAFIEKVITRDEFSSMPLILDRSMSFSDLIKPNTGIINAEMYFDEIMFTIRGKTPGDISFSYGGKKETVEKVLLENDILHFTVPLPLGRKDLLIYFDREPALGFKVD
jgi:transglutaminase/protease-like cytokinesis protein 3